MEPDFLSERQPITHRVTDAEAGLSLVALGLQLAGEAGACCVARGGAWIDGRRTLEAERRLTAAQTITLRFPPRGSYSDLTLTAADIAYEDAWLVALHKQAGWYVGPTPWDDDGHVLAALRRYLMARDGFTPTLHLAHRLDRDTSGVLLCSRDPAANPALQTAFAEGRVTKRYACICAGIPAWDTTELLTGHGRSAGGRWRVYPHSEIGHELPHGGGRIKVARTRFGVERRLEAAALLRAEPHTGRTHQIRLHLAHLGYPLLGDLRYGGPALYQGQALDAHLLHAEMLHLIHPISGASLVLSSPLPTRFTSLLGGEDKPEA